MAEALTRRQRWLVAACGLLVLLSSALRFDGPARGYWDTYITVPAMFMTGQRVELTRMDGSPRYQYQLAGRVPDDTYDPRPGSFGIASEDQRIGTGILFAAPFALARVAAFRWGFAACWALTFLFGFLALRRLVGGFVVPLAAALVLVFNPFSLYLERLNGNLFGLGILTFLTFLLLEPAPCWWLIGLVYGVLGGIRNEAIVLGPMFLGALWWRTGDWRSLGLKLAQFTAAAFLAILPVLLWNRFAYGQMLIHPSQVDHLEGFRPTFPHHFLGLEFAFNGLLNVPFHDHLVRTPHFAFPTFVHWPLVTLQGLGLLLSAVTALGVVAAWRRARAQAGLLIFWYLIIFILFAAQENWEELKQTFMALHLFPLMAFLAFGLDWLKRHARQLRAWMIPAALALALGLGVRALAHWEVPADERWYVRFPHAAANSTGLDGLPEGLRKDWHFFHTRETPAEYQEERRHMTRACVLPCLYRPVHLPDAGTLERIAAEPSTASLTTLAYWSYIYE
jgi:hypothetical protein